MAFGSGLYTEQNKTLPGSYYKFSTQSVGSVTYAERGVVGLIAPSDWTDGKVSRMVAAAYENAYDPAIVFPRDAMAAIGYGAGVEAPETYDGSANAMTKFLPAFVRDVFKQSPVLYIYPVVGTGAAKASCNLGTAKKMGTRGNALTLSVVKKDNNYVVTTIMDGEVVDVQTVAAASALVDNDYVEFKTSASLTASASIPFTGGTNGSYASSYDAAAAVETLGGYGVNVVACMVASNNVLDAVIAQNEEYGHWMQLVAPQSAVTIPNGGNEYLIVPKIGNATRQELIVPWVAAAEAGCALNTTLDANVCDSELVVWLMKNDNLVAPTQTTLKETMGGGFMAIHAEGDDWLVLNDNNTLIKFNESKDEAFGRNQTIRVLQTVAGDWHQIFVREFLGKAGTADADLVNFKTRLVNNVNHYASLGAIKNFDSSDIVVTTGKQSDSYHVTSYLQPNYCVRKVYADVTLAPFIS